MNDLSYKFPKGMLLFSLKHLDHYLGYMDFEFDFFIPLTPIIDHLVNDKRVFKLKIEIKLNFIYFTQLEKSMSSKETPDIEL